MTPALRVIAGGLSTTVQDLGRPGYQHLGVPPSGALDPVGLRAANALAGNAPGAGALEALYLGPTLAVEAEEVRLAFAGAAAKIEVLAHQDAVDGRRIETMRSVRLSRGEIVRVVALTGGAVLYIAVEGGFDIAPVLGSVSTYRRGGFGGFDGRALTAGDRLPLVRDRASGRDDCRLVGLKLGPATRLRVMAGPQRDYFSDDALAVLFASPYAVGAGSDRMGMRLEGATIAHTRGFDITSDAIAPGSIQVPGDGCPIVLLADRQTTGGYPKIATVISADLPALGRLPIGAKVALAPVTLEDAEAARRELLALIDSMPNRVVPLAATPETFAPRLYDCNLISGVADAQNLGT
jgi:biotin-dependent carboxylase-like uncharacterized protein